MQVMILVLNEIEKLDDILMLFQTLGISGATIFDTVGAGKTLAESSISYALTYSLRKFLEGGRPYNKTIMSVMSDEQVDQFINSIHGIIDFSKPGTGVLFTMPVGRVMGLCRNL